VLFSHIYKPVKSLFEDNYNQSKVSVKTKTKPNKNLELNFETARDKGKEFESKLAWVGTFDVSNLNIKVDGEVKQVGEFSEKATVKGLYDGFVVEKSIKLLTNIDENPKLLPPSEEKKKKTRDEVSLGVTYAHKNADVSAKITKKQINPFLFSGSLALHLDEFTVGGDAELEFKEKKEGEEFLRNYNFGGSYKNDNLHIVSTVVDKLSKANLGIVHKINKNTALGFEFTHKLSKNVEPFEVQVGVSHKLDDQSSFKGKLLSSGLLSASYQVKVKPELNVTVSLETSAKEISQGKIGVELAFEPLD